MHNNLLFKFDIGRLAEKSRFWGCQKLIFQPQKSIKSRFWRPEKSIEFDKKDALVA